MKEIVLLHGERALVDDEDYERLSPYRWYLNNWGYAVRSEGNSKRGTYRIYLMHREVLGEGAGEYTDHINGDGLDNRKANLRPATAAENARHRTRGSNKTGYRGVFRARKRFGARITFEGRKLHLGYFDTAQQAHRAYLRKAEELFGAFVPSFEND